LLSTLQYSMVDAQNREGLRIFYLDGFKFVAS
jgi:hypothetical protein